MPEDDRFSKCMPKGYKSAYLRARKGHSEFSVARTLASGIARHMKEGKFSLGALGPMLKALQKALDVAEGRRGELFHPMHDVRTTFSYELERIALQHGFGFSARVLREVTQQTFEKLCDRENLAEATTRTFCEELTRTLAGHCCFAVEVGGVTARDEIMRRNQWESSTQSDFEARVCGAVVGVVEDLVKQSLRAPDTRPKRTPPLPERPSKFSLDEMDLPLAGAETP